MAKAMLDRSHHFGRQVEDGIMGAHDLIQGEPARPVGASPETVNKALADFASPGWIKLKARTVVLIDVERVRGRPN